MSDSSADTPDRSPPREVDPPNPDGVPSGPPSDGPHLATVSFQGHFWDVYVEMVDDPSRTDRIQGRLCYSAADRQGASPVRTAPILIEPSYQEVLHRARAFEEHQLVGLLRSCLPEAELDDLDEGGSEG